ncbi:27707_t:CDS:2 [Dentiscutata erythropus]|uniref:27707_t:CDS:1 n=1 Tax=Dentiscutata erythropus TaxID=1348616 RepID=A0A9N8ZDN2_9GLOM|nr:27707_t:CDS:2 [Dentiscutata erythropus]
MNNDDILINGPDKSSHKTQIMEKLEKYNPSLVLENKASVARDHLGEFTIIVIHSITQSILTGGGLDSNNDDEARNSFYRFWNYFSWIGSL